MFKRKQRFKSAGNLWAKKTVLGQVNEALGIQVFSSTDSEHTTIPFVNNVLRDFTRNRQYTNHEQPIYDYDKGCDMNHREPWAQKTFNLTYELIKDYVALDDRILDVCCGSGWHLEQFQKQGFTNLAGIDIDPVQIDYAKKKRPSIDFTNGMFGKPEFDITCDCMVWFDSISRISYHLRLFEGINRCARKFVVINSQEASNDLYRDPHYNLAKKGFMLLEKRTVTEENKNLGPQDDFKPFGTLHTNRKVLDLQEDTTHRLFRSVYLFMRV
ncbi:MAG: hypothetical protein CMF69_06630 [Magnetovibrio sp.]|nr:hypothetical protein [Magnetovibrio sp.]|tara:strand:+ start:1136 stop:1945 length:810 start_codon:yes stop_codon:yes gene_type:complete